MRRAGARRRCRGRRAIGRVRRRCPNCGSGTGRGRAGDARAGMRIVELPDGLHRSIARGVVHDHHLEVTEILAEATHERAPDEGFTVVHRDDNAEKRRHPRVPIKGSSVRLTPGHPVHARSLRSSANFVACSLAVARAPSSPANSLAQTITDNGCRARDAAEYRQAVDPPARHEAGQRPRRENHPIGHRGPAPQRGAVDGQDPRRIRGIVGGVVQRTIGRRNRYLVGRVVMVSPDDHRAGLDQVTARDVQVVPDRSCDWSSGNRIAGNVLAREHGMASPRPVASIGSSERRKPS